MHPGSCTATVVKGIQDEIKSANMPETGAAPLIFFPIKPLSLNILKLNWWKGLPFIDSPTAVCPKLEFSHWILHFLECRCLSSSLTMPAKNSRTWDFPASKQAAKNIHTAKNPTCAFMEQIECGVETMLSVGIYLLTGIDKLYEWVFVHHWC